MTEGFLFFTARMHRLFIVLFTVATLAAEAQILDTICYSFGQKPRIFFQLDTYNSFVSREPANTIGLRAGLEFNRRVRTALGIYTLTSDIVKPKLIIGEFSQDTVLNSRLELNFIPLSFEYLFLNRHPWEIGLQIALGVGSSYFFYWNQQGKKSRVDEKEIILMTVAGDVQYKITRWLGVGSGLGFRLMIKDNSNIDENFNSIIYCLQLRLFPGVVLKAIFKGKNDRID
jgi:hypothetical protein